MRCTFRVDGEPAATWAEERTDLPLYRGGVIAHNDDRYEILDGPHYEADWESSSITATFVVKAAPTDF